jgi:hypothetical protein
MKRLARDWELIFKGAKLKSHARTPTKNAPKTDALPIGGHTNRSLLKQDPITGKTAIPNRTSF